MLGSNLGTTKERFRDFALEAGAAMSMLENADPVSRAFLGVERSVTGQRWVARLDQAGENRALAMSQNHGLPDLISRVLAGRGVPFDTALEFLDPTLRRLMPEPYSLMDCEAATERLARAIEEVGEKVLDVKRQLGLRG